MPVYVYTIAVELGEANYLREALRDDLLIDQSRWELEEDAFTNTTVIVISTPGPLSLIDRRKIVSCGLSVHLSEV